MLMHTVVETPSYLASADDEGMTEAEMKATVDLISTNPDTGALIVGSGGCRKVRVAGKGKGKSGGYRVVTYYYNDLAPVFLLAVLAKGTRANFSRAECNTLASVAERISDAAKRQGKGNE